MLAGTTAQSSNSRRMAEFSKRRNFDEGVYQAKLELSYAYVR